MGWWVVGGRGPSKHEADGHSLSLGRRGCSEPGRVPVSQETSWYLPEVPPAREGLRFLHRRDADAY